MKIVDIHFLQESTNLHFIISDTVSLFIDLYWSPNQSLSEFNLFTKNLEPGLDMAANYNPVLVVVLDDFDAKYLNWCCHDKTNLEGCKT